MVLKRIARGLEEAITFTIRDFLLYLIELAESHLIVLSVFILVLDTFTLVPPHRLRLLMEADLVVSVLLAIAYASRVAGRREDKLRYLLRSSWEWPGFVPLYAIYWLEELAHIHASAHELAPLLLVVRSVRFIRLGILMYRTRELIDTFSFVFRDVNFTKVLFLTLITIATSATAFYVVEAGYSVNSFWEALWFTIVTITTVGYGDITPQTSLGKAITALIMLVGISLWGLIIGSISTIFGEVAQKRITTRISRLEKRLEKRIRELEERVEEARREARAATLPGTGLPRLSGEGFEENARRMVKQLSSEELAVLARIVLEEYSSRLRRAKRPPSKE